MKRKLQNSKSVEHLIWFFVSTAVHWGHIWKDWKPVYSIQHKVIYHDHLHYLYIYICTVLMANPFHMLLFAVTQVRVTQEINNLLKGMWHSFNRSSSNLPPGCSTSVLFPWFPATGDSWETTAAPRISAPMQSKVQSVPQDVDVGIGGPAVADK